MSFTLYKQYNYLNNFNQLIMSIFYSAVTLIVKSCNQQFEDQEIRCELNWTIRKLKQQLTEVYPTKPVSCQ